MFPADQLLEYDYDSFLNMRPIRDQPSKDSCHACVTYPPKTALQLNAGRSRLPAFWCLRCLWRIHNRLNSKLLVAGIEVLCYFCKMSALKNKRALAGLSAEEQRIMRQLLQTPPEPYKAVPKPATPQGEAQRRRREKERKHFSEASREIWRARRGSH
jgi:hypothetical protein